jgi:hypothetical protein
VRLIEHASREPTEVQRITLVRNGKAPYRNAVDLFHAGGSLVPPGDVIAGARRHDLNLRVASKSFGYVPRMEFCAAVDVRAIALDRDRELHDSERSPAFESKSPPLESELVADE